MRKNHPAQLWNEMASTKLSQSTNNVIKHNQSMDNASLCSSKWISDSLEGFSSTVHQFLSYLIQFLSRELQGEVVIAQQITPQSKKPTSPQSLAMFRENNPSSGQSHRSDEHRRAAKIPGFALSLGSQGSCGEISYFWSCSARSPWAADRPTTYWRACLRQCLTPRRWWGHGYLWKNESLTGRCPQHK